jgi:hypothetical protein
MPIIIVEDGDSIVDEIELYARYQAYASATRAIGLTPLSFEDWVATL